MSAAATLDDLRRENEELRQQLDECQATIRAISAGEVDAFLVRQGAEDQVLVLDGVDRPYRLLIEQMQQGALTTTSDGTIIFANRCFAEMIALPLPSLPGTRLAEHICESDRLQLLSLLGASLEGRGSAELALCRTDGSQLSVLVTASVLQHEAQVLCLVVTDLTQQKAQEQERELLVQAQAARRAAEHTAALLRDTDRRKDEFLAMLAHELRNPLASLRTGLQVLNRISSQEPAVLQTREMMGRQIENLVRLVDDLLDVSRVTQGKIKLQKERTDLAAIVSRALETSRQVIAARGLPLEVSLPDVPMPVEADMVRAAQVLINLLNNAAKFTSPGGNIRLTVTKEGETAVVRVKDSGVGIAPEMLTKVFDLFMQADPSTSRSEGGLGIGLTLSRRLMEMHGGSLDAASAGLGKGSEFTARFPLVAETSPTLSEAVRPASGRRARVAPRRILIVDDNRDAASSLAMLLKLLGHEVHQAHDGRQALEVAAKFLPEVVLLDIGLPGMSGYVVAAEMKALPTLKHTRLVALTGYGSDDDRHRSRAAGFHDHLVKPVDLPALETLLATPAQDARV